MLVRIFLIAVLALITIPVQAAEIIELTQTPCQFIEPEGGNLGFASTKKADCQAINSRTGEDRLSKAIIMELKSGDYVFRVLNKSVSYSLGFWLREADYDWRNPVHKLTKISISGGGLKTGVSKDYKVTLEPGEYLYSCPLNTTPDYKIVVTQ